MNPVKVLVPWLYGSRYGVVQTGSLLQIICDMCGSPTTTPFSYKGNVVATCDGCNKEIIGPSWVGTSDIFSNGIHISTDHAPRGNNAREIGRWIEAWTGLKNVEVRIED